MAIIYLAELGGVILQIANWLCFPDESSHLNRRICRLLSIKPMRNAWLVSPVSMENPHDASYLTFSNSGSIPEGFGYIE